MRELHPSFRLQATVKRSNTCPIAGEFTRTFGGDFAYDPDGSIEFPQRIITHQEKRAYVLAVSKGRDVDGPNGPAGAYEPVDVADRHVPIDQCCFVGDGNSDFPAFELMREKGGLAIGVVPGESLGDWDHGEQVREGRRLDNLARADYSEGGELLESLTLAATSLATRARLRQLGHGK